MDWWADLQKTIPFGEDKSSLSAWQRTGPQLRRRHGQIVRIILRAVDLSTAFSKFSLHIPVLVSKFGKFTSRAEIWVQTPTETAILKTSGIPFSKIFVFLLLRPVDNKFYIFCRHLRNLKYNCFLLPISHPPLYIYVQSLGIITQFGLNCCRCELISHFAY